MNDLWGTSPVFIHLLIFTALGSCWPPCRQRFPLCSFRRPPPSLGEGWESDRPSWETIATYFLLLWMQLHMPEKQERIHHTSTPHAIPFVLTSGPNACHWFSRCCLIVSPTESYACRSSAGPKSQGKDTENEKHMHFCVLWNALK